MDKKREIFNLPNIITMTRISIVPFLFFLLTSPGPFWSLVLAVLFVVAAVTDVLD
ncbi:MAG: CDP-alcohol phosphatidyltransferase family protein, partial [Smithella sp.]